MPSVLEYWSSMPYTTTYGYLKRYPTIEQILQGVIRHASEKNIAIWAEPGEHVNVEMLKACCNQQRKKRSLIQQQQPPIKRQKLNDTVPITPDFVENIVSDFTDTIVPDFTDTIVPDFTDTIVPDFTDTIVPHFTNTDPVYNAINYPAPSCCTNTYGTGHMHIMTPLVLNGVTIEVDPVTFMVNATQMCKAAGKKYFEYARHEKGKLFIKALESKTGIPALDLVISNQGGDHSGTMVHRLIAYDLASWLSGDIKLQFYMWNDELLLTGRVELGKEMNVQQLVPIVQPEQPMAQALVQEADAPPASSSNGTYKPLVLNGIAIEVDPVTLMVNATQMCKAAGKLFGGYYRQKSTNDYLKALSSVMRINITELVVINQGGNPELQGTWVHRRVALHLAQSISPVFAAHVTGWIEQLFTTGRVELGKEMNVQQLEDVWKRRIEEGEAKAAMDLDAEQERCRKLELRLAIIQDAHQRSDEEKKALVAIKVREDLEAAIRFQVETTAPRIASYKEGDNVLYLARIDGTKFKYGQTKNLGQRHDTHSRPGVYPTFQLVGILSCANAVASEDKVRAYVKKTNIGVEYGTQREIVVLETLDALQRMMNKMQKSCRQRPASEGSEVLLRRIEVKASIKMKKIDARVDMEKIKAGLEEKKIALY
jgi:hypothetical protein